MNNERLFRFYLALPGTANHKFETHSAFNADQLKNGDDPLPLSFIRTNVGGYVRYMLLRNPQGQLDQWRDRATVTLSAVRASAITIDHFEDACLDRLTEITEIYPSTVDLPTTAPYIHTLYMLQDMGAPDITIEIVSA